MVALPPLGGGLGAWHSRYVSLFTPPPLARPVSQLSTATTLRPASPVSLTPTLPSVIDDLSSYEGSVPIDLRFHSLEYCDFTFTTISLTIPPDSYISSSSDNASVIVFKDCSDHSIFFTADFKLDVLKYLPKPNKLKNIDGVYHAGWFPGQTLIFEFPLTLGIFIDQPN